MNLSDKIIKLRKSNGMSQEELADKINVSRQAISRWETGSAMPDGTNILKISKLFGVTTDYLLNDDYQSDNDLPKVKEIKDHSFKQILIFLVTLEVMILLMQFMTTFILQNVFFAFLSFIPFVAIIGGFEYAYKKKAEEANKSTGIFRKKFYKISTWLGLYFPIRFLTTTIMSFYPRSYSSLILEFIVLSIYIGVSFIITLYIQKNYLLKEE